MLKEKLKNSLSISIKIFLVSLLAFANLQLVFAAAPAGPALDRNGFSNFDVSKFLTVSSTAENKDTTGSQGQLYLKSSNPVASFVLQVINLLTLIAASFSFLAVVVGGFYMMSAAGNETQINKGKDVVGKAIIGLALTLSSYFIVSFVQNLFFESAPK